MPYGEGYSDEDLKKIQRDYAKTDDNHTYQVVTAKGSRLTVKGINSARAVAGKDGTYKRKGK